MAVSLVWDAVLQGHAGCSYELIDRFAHEIVAILALSGAVRSRRLNAKPLGSLFCAILELHAPTMASAY